MLSAFKNFFVTFLVAAIVFGAAAFFATGFLTDTITGIFDSEASELEQILNPTETTPPTTDTGDDPAPPEIIVSGDSFNMLFIVTDYRPDVYDDYLPDDVTLSEMEANPDITTGVLDGVYRRTRADVILLVRADKARGEFITTVFPENLTVPTSSGEHFLGDIYHLYGREYIVSEISAMTGLTIDHHFLVNMTELSAIVDSLEGYTIYLENDLYYDGRTSTNIEPGTVLPDGAETQPDDTLPEDPMTAPKMELLYSAGRNTVDGEGTIALLSNTDSDFREHDRSECIINIFTAILNKLTSMNEGELVAFYDDMINDGLADTTFTPQLLAEESEVIYLWQGDLFHKITATYPGTYTTDTETETLRFTPDRTAGVKLFQKYRDLLGA